MRALLGSRSVYVVVPAFARRLSETTVSLRPSPSRRAVGRSTVSLAVTRHATAQRTLKRTVRLPEAGSVKLGARGAAGGWRGAGVGDRRRGRRRGHDRRRR